MDRFGDGAYAAVGKRGRGLGLAISAPARLQTAGERRRRGGGRGKRQGQGQARVECRRDGEYVVCESRLVFAGRRHVLAPAGITRRITHLTRLLTLLTHFTTRLPFHDTNEGMCWRHKRCRSVPATSFQAAAVNACGGEGGCCGAAEQDESELSSFVESERRTPLPPPPAWQAPPQLLALLAAAAALRGERACLCRHEVASIASISAAADLGSSAAACFADMWRIAAARLASASYQNRLCKV